MKFRKKPVEIEAIPFIDILVNDAYEFLGITNKGNFNETGMGIDPSDGKFKITTLEGVMVVNENDYIIKGVKGEFYPCKPDIFEMTYDKVEEGSTIPTTLKFKFINNDYHTISIRIPIEIDETLKADLENQFLKLPVIVSFEENKVDKILVKYEDK